MPSILNNMVAHAKAHHESVNAAYSAVYSPRRSIQSSRKNSTTEEEATTPSHPAPPNNLTKAWTSLKKSAKAHHEGVNAAYNAYYAPGIPTPNESRAHSAASSRRQSVEEEVRHEEEVEHKQRNITKAWNKVKKAAIEHNKSVNSAYMAVYGGAAAL